MPAPIRVFTAPSTWYQMDGKQIWAGDVSDEPNGHRMSAGFARLRSGEVVETPAPYDEVWIVLRGALTFHGAGNPVHAATGDLVYIPEGTPGTTHVGEDAELVLAAHPPRWTIDDRDREAAIANPRADAAPRRFAMADVHDWGWVDDQPAQLVYAADEAEGSAFGIGFGRSKGAMSMDFRWN